MSTLKRFILVGIIVSGFSSGSYANTQNIEIDRSKLSTISVPFIKNIGQNHPDVAFYAKTFSGTLFVDKQGGLIYSLPISKSDKHHAWAIRESLVNSQKVIPQAGQASKTRISYFKGQKKNWRTNLKSYADVKLNNAYPGIDIQLKARTRNIEKLFFVQPEADASQIQLQVDGVTRMSVNEQKQLVLHTDAGDIAFTAPVAYQVIDKQKVPVNVAYVVNDNKYGFTLGQYDKSHTLVIDPLLASTFLGGDNTNAISDFEFIGDIVVKDNYVYVAGTTDSSNFPVTAGFDTDNSGSSYDGFVVKLDASLSTMVAGTFIGGDSYDDVYGLALDDAGNVYVDGRAGSQNFPYIGGGYHYYSDVYAGTFIAKFSNDLSSLLATSFPAGSSLPGKLVIANNSVYLAGRINSPNVPVTPDAYDTTCGGDGKCDPSGSFNATQYYGYIVRQDMNLTGILAATYLGRSGGSDIGVASNSNVYVIALGDVVLPTRLQALDQNLTTSIGAVEYGPYGTTFHSLDVNDAFVVAIGSTTRTDLPVTTNAYDPSCGTDGACDPVGATNYPTSDTFVARYSLDLQTTEALTYFGGSGGDSPADIKIDADSNIVVAGNSSSTDLPTSSNGFDRTLNGKSSGYIAKFNSDLSSLLYGSYIGGSNGSLAYDLATASNGEVYMVGSTGSADFPVTSAAFDTSYNGGDVDVFVSLFDTSGTSGGGGGGGGGADNQAPVADAGTDQTVSPRTRVHLDGSGSYDADGTITSYAWTQISGKSVRLNNADSAVANFKAPRVRRNTTATLIFELTVTDDQGASASSQVTVSVTR